ncbi:hypothetical protein GI584_00105 [Gracilibacillus salitolerans]|uniref:Type II toxin-antitoxin system PemK/MazF family toxin n=1 Tax=Gracilibacillus salitolerans TaxID=2663022 RepID=A0A5Q2TER2_9BACI|nr:type II toxin-antitoxin system PemK/MazF family toxin [Gracilibacillus salitolerans]QGH32581.1 hypothetical protein GI584_00105 [Gracilibacillus salitolerans]
MVKISKNSYKIKRSKFKRKYVSKLKNLTDDEKNMRSGSDPNLILDTKRLLDDFFSVIMSLKLEDGLKWILGLEEYIEDKKNKKQIHYRRYTRGHIVEVELFGHFDKELTYSHPALILYDGGNSVLVAPISGGKYGDDKEMHIDVTEKDGLRKNCAVMVDSLRIIDKKRILYQHKKDELNVKISTEILDNIDNVLISKFIPGHKIKYDQLKSDFYKEIEKNEVALSEIEELKKALELKNKEINEIKEKITIE